jgi:hypothetical protein
MYASKVISGLAVVGFAAAASSATPTQCSQATATIASQADVSPISVCETFSGDILITSAASGEIDLTGINQITGSLMVIGATNLATLTAPTLNSISEVFNMTDLTVLSTLSFPELTSVGSIIWKTLPALDALTFSSVVTQASVVNIQDTQLTSLNGINLATVDTMFISNNRMLTTISTQVANVTTSLEIDSNGLGLSVELPNLSSSLGDLTIRNASSITIPSLATVNGTLSFLFNTIDSIIAPNLTFVNGLAVNGNGDITNVSMNALKNIGKAGIQIENNTQLASIDGFPALLDIAGALNILGNFTELSMPKVTEVGGAFIAKSSSNFSCAYFDNLNKNAKILSTTYDCVPTAVDVTDDGNTTSTSGSNPSGTGSGSSPTSSKKSSADMLNAPIALALIGGFLALLL